MSNLPDTRLVAGSPIEMEEHRFFKHVLEIESSLICKRLDKLVPPSFKLAEWVEANFNASPDDRIMFDERCAVVHWENRSGTTAPVRVNIQMYRNKIIFQVFGVNIASIEAFFTWVGTQGFLEEDIMVTWAFGPSYDKMETYEVPLTMPPLIPGAYPWMTKSVQQLSDEFMSSSASVLVLIGPPGTGKTTFLKHLIKASGKGAMVTYDTGLLFSDGFFASYMGKHDTSMLILEDADNMMESRRDGNTIMHKFLNASDGLISMKSKKLVFSTNLPNINSIDAALLRPGRCFDIVPFRNLSKDEASAVANNYYGKDVELTRKEYSLAEVLNLNASSLKERTAQKVGFTA